MIGGGEQLSATESITTTGIARQDIRDAQARGQDAIRRMEEAMGIPTANIVPLDFQNRCAVVGRSRYTSRGTDSAAATATTAIGGSATAAARGGANHQAQDQRHSLDHHLDPGQFAEQIQSQHLSLPSYQSKQHYRHQDMSRNMIRHPASSS